MTKQKHINNKLIVIEWKIAQAKRGKNKGRKYVNSLRTSLGLQEISSEEVKGVLRTLIKYLEKEEEKEEKNAGIHSDKRH